MPTKSNEERTAKMPAKTPKQTKTSTHTPAVKVKDLKAKKNPKGGAYQVYRK